MRKGSKRVSLRIYGEGRRYWEGTHEREEEDRDDILDLRNESDGEPSLVRDSERSDEPSEDGVDSDDVSDEGGGEDEEESQGPVNGKQRSVRETGRGGGRERDATHIMKGVGCPFSIDPVLIAR